MCTDMCKTELLTLGQIHERSLPLALEAIQTMSHF